MIVYIKKLKTIHENSVRRNFRDPQKLNMRTIFTSNPLLKTNNTINSCLNKSDNQMKHSLSLKLVFILFCFYFF